MVGSDGKSQHRNKLCVSLSSCRKNLKLKKVNKSYVPEPISCFSDSYMRMNITNVVCICKLLVYVSWSCFLDVDILQKEELYPPQHFFVVAID